MYWVHTCTYSVQGYSCSIPRLQRHSDVTVLQLGLLQSTNSVHTWYGTVLQWYILCYSMKPLVLVYSSTYLLVMQFMIQEKLTFWLGTLYILICTALLDVSSSWQGSPRSMSWSAGGCWASGTSMFASSSTPQNPVQQVSEQVHTKYILDTYWVHTSIYWVHTYFILSIGLCLLHSQTVTLQWLSRPATLSTSKYKLCAY
jgi:hypothetical protein